MAYEERMKKLNMELKKLQGFQQQSELEVRVWGAGEGKGGVRSGSLPVRGPQGHLLQAELFSTQPYPLATGVLSTFLASGLTGRQEAQNRGALCWSLEIKGTLPHNPLQDNLPG